MTKRYLYLTALFMLLSCSAFAQQYENKSKNSRQGGQDEMDLMMNQFLGFTKKDLLMTWGMPAAVVPDGEGGEIVKFEDVKSAVVRGGRMTTTHTYLWFFDKEGKAYYWKYDMVWSPG
ncbi:hypothetical protein H8S95_09805 [Pontibacter sp. KCTC 32443]|uniref:hypothetical protein n=1 Tax=Pontibacter TaxID=323449 RepID=UPI00164DCFD7|nr:MULTISPECIES: hypothetical protein [Pontibacter]MBC5774354.1 hypothetical protein [Pontibacter sp. KCTC 32443]